MSVDDDDRPTVVLDLNVLKKQKLKQEEELANIAQELEFAVPADDEVASSVAPEEVSTTEVEPLPAAPVALREEPKLRVILFDFQSDFFKKSKAQLPKGFDYQVASTLNDLNKLLVTKVFQICVFNYDVNPKAVNQLTAQIKQKFPLTKTLIMAKAISPEKAKIHQKTPSGASGYYQFPIDSKRVEVELLKIKKLSN
jgi:hypothetical protein